jgi:hypothetical protein
VNFVESIGRQKGHQTAFYSLLCQMHCIVPDCLDTHCPSSFVASVAEFVHYSNPAFIGQLQARCPLDQNELTFLSASPGAGTRKRPYKKTCCLYQVRPGARPFESSHSQLSAVDLFLWGTSTFPSWVDNSSYVVYSCLFRGCVSRSICACAMGSWPEDFSAKWGNGTARPKR